MRWRIGYNTNGFQSHRLLDALRVMVEIGYNSVALTLDHCHLDPFRSSDEEIGEVKDFLKTHQMSCVIETGARYLLDPLNKHRPTLMSRGRKKRVEFLKLCVDMAEKLGATCVTFFSGIPDEGEDPALSYEKLAEGVEGLVKYGREKGVILALEPEPGMLVECLNDYLYVKQLTGLEDLKLTMDIGHIKCTEKISIPQALHSYTSEIVNIHLEDIKGRVHEHLPFGQGDIDFKPVFNTLNKIGPAFPIHVELSRSSHAAVQMARQSYKFLSQYLW